MWLWTATYVKSLTVLDIEDLTREAYANLKLKVEAKRKVMKEPKKENGDRGGSRLLDGCGIMMRPYEGHDDGRRYGTSHLLNLRRSA